MTHELLHRMIDFANAMPLDAFLNHGGRSIVDNLRKEIATQPSQALELSDDPLQGAVDWFLQADGEFFCVATVQHNLRIGYNRAQRLCDIAKERAAINAKEAV